MGIRAAEVDVEKEQAVILFEGDEFWHIEARVVQKVELALQVEVEQAFGGAVRGDDAVAEAGFLGGFREFGPIFVVADFSGRWKRDGKASATAWVFHF